MLTVEKVMTAEEKKDFEEVVKEVRTDLFHIQFYLEKDGDKEALLLHMDSGTKASLTANLLWLANKLELLS